jgi:quercetin dioxygenase-like cupin family protein
MTSKHTYVKTHKISGAVMTPDVAAQGEAVLAQAQSAKAGRAAKTLAKVGQMRLTVIGMKRGVSLGAHTAEGAVTIHILKGRCRLDASGGHAELGSGELVVLKPRVEHSMTALRDSIVLLTVAMEPNAS